MAARQLERNEEQGIIITDLAKEGLDCAPLDRMSDIYQLRAEVVDGQAGVVLYSRAQPCACEDCRSYRYNICNFRDITGEWKRQNITPKEFKRVVPSNFTQQSTQQMVGFLKAGGPLEMSTPVFLFGKKRDIRQGSEQPLFCAIMTKPPTVATADKEYKFKVGRTEAKETIHQGDTYVEVVVFECLDKPGNAASNRFAKPATIKVVCRPLSEFILHPSLMETKNRHSYILPEPGEPDLLHPKKEARKVELVLDHSSY